MYHSPELLVTQRTSNTLSPGLPFQAAFGGKRTRQDTGVLLTLCKTISKKPKYFLRNKFKDDENNMWL